MLTSRSAFERLNGFDERYFLYFEDIDFCFRGLSAGMKVAFFDDWVLFHYRGASAATVSEAASKNYRDSQIKFFKVHGVGLARYFMPWWGRIRKRFDP